MNNGRLKAIATSAAIIMGGHIASGASAASCAPSAVAPAAPGPVRPLNLKGWEEAAFPRQAVEEIEVVASGKYVYVASTQPVKVTILTVLGQPLTDVTLPAGSHRFHISTRGIYILRAGSLTFRIKI